jgi:hypothetical protein
MLRVAKLVYGTTTTFWLYAIPTIIVWVYAIIGNN